MRDIIKKQLEKVTVADISNYDDSTGIINIPKYQKPSYEIGKCYIVKVNDNVINNTTSVLATNWNNGSAPRAAYLKIYVSKILGANIYVDSLAYNIETQTDLTDIWAGWLNVNELNQIGGAF